MKGSSETLFFSLNCCVIPTCRDNAFFLYLSVQKRKTPVCRMLLLLLLELSLMRFPCDEPG